MKVGWLELWVIPGFIITHLSFFMGGFVNYGSNPMNLDQLWVAKLALSNIKNYCDALYN